MDDVQRALHDAWRRIRPVLENDPTELHRRLARRESKLITSPPRAWCLAIRSNDTRLTSLCREHPDRSRKNVVRITSADLRRLCSPVHITAPGQPIDEVANLLGVRPSSLRNARLSNLFHTHYVPGLGGHCGKPRPLLYTPRPLDPQSRGFHLADELWSITARHAPLRIPKNIRATLRRVPVYQPRATHLDRDPQDLHPEDPALSEQREPKGMLVTSASQTRDYVWYKWQNDNTDYAGHDWRNPQARLNYERREAQLTKQRRRMRERRVESTALSLSKGSLSFRGWRWLCPRCGKKVNMLFLPLPRLALISPFPSSLPKKLSAVSSQLSARGQTHPASLRPSVAPSLLPPAFACKHCHRVRCTSGIKKSAWGEIVAYLSAGLLYGNEVKRPAWFKPTRRYRYVPRLNHPPSRRRAQIERGLLQGKKIKEIAADLGLSFGTVLWYAQQIYPMHGVTCLKELLVKHGIPPRPHLRGKALGKRGEGRVRRKRIINEPAVLRTSANSS